MKQPNTPRGKRTQMKAWVFLALFGSGDDSDEPTDDATAGAADDGDATDGDPPAG